MQTRVLITVDTELTERHRAAGLSWRENFERSFEAAGVGVPYQLERLAEHGLKACFFVDPMPALAYGMEPVRLMIEPILAAGQEVQLHLHPFWSELGRAGGERYELGGFDAADQAALIREARDLLIAAGAPAPIAFRAGSYAADADTLAALPALGIQYDSSHNGSHHPWPSALPLDPRRVAPARCGGVIEVPVTQIEDGPDRLRHLQLCAVSIDELKAAMLHARDNRHPLVTLVSHSFELATRDGLRANELLRRRFESLCRFLADNRAAMQTAHFTDLDDLALDAPSRPLPARRLRAGRRKVEQFWSDTRYEHPANAVTALSGSSISGIEAMAPLLGI